VTSDAATPHIVFVCWGNICRSPMAERVAEKMARDAGVNASFTSAATSTEELGNPMDRRAARVLTARGYRTAHHVAHQVTVDEIRHADLVIAMEQIHIDKMRRLVPDADNLALMTDFDPTATPGSGIDDPWYVPDSAFNITLDRFERIVPNLLDWIHQATEYTMSTAISPMD